MKKKKTEIAPKFSIGELFCGCGGTSYGFESTGKFATIFGNDVKDYALQAFAENHSLPDPKNAILGDVREIPLERFDQILKSSGISRLDCLIGGPPCQGFSQNRRSRKICSSGLSKYSGYDKLDEDPRNELVLRFMEIVDHLRPNVVVIENVPQFLKHYHDGKKGGLADTVEDLLTDMGYHVTCAIVLAADYGVPQLRNRAIVIGSRFSKIELEPTHGQNSALGDGSHVTVFDAISDLPTPSKQEAKSSYVAKDSEHSFQKMMRKRRRLVPNGHTTREYSKSVSELIAEANSGENWDEISQRKRIEYENLIRQSQKKGESLKATRERLEKAGAINPRFYKKYYWSAYTRMNWHSPALTVTANCNFLGSGRYTHPEQNRGITPREAARLQSFDDAFSFPTDPETKIIPRSLAMDMIGEAVPPILAKCIAKQIIDHFSQHSHEK